MSRAEDKVSGNSVGNKPTHPYANIPLETRIQYLRTVPKEMQAAPQWLLFRLTPRLAVGQRVPDKWDKVPYYSNGSKRYGDQNTDEDRERMTTLPQAVKALRAKSDRFHGVGFAVLDGGVASVIDLDGAESVEAHRYLTGGTWSERSVSGVGMHAFFRGSLGTNKKNIKAGIEAYSSKGFIAVTGMQADGTALAQPLAPAAGMAGRMAGLLAPDDTDAGGSPARAVGGNLPRSIATPMTRELRARLKAALRCLDADTDYDTWNTVGMALHSTHPKIDGPAFSLWNAWSASGEAKYRGPDDLTSHWRSFRAGRGITEGTIFAMADKADKTWRKRYDASKEKTKPKEPEKDESVDAADEDFGDVDDGPKVVITMLDSVEAVAQSWLLRHMFARGEITLLTGDGGTNKSSMSHAIAHVLVNGGRWPLGGFEYSGEDIKPQGEVLIMCGEEGLATSIVPRLVMQGTDRSKIGVIDLATDYDEKGHVLGGIATFSEHLRMIEKAIESRGPGKVALLIVDPLTGYLGVENQNAESEVRPVLVSMVQMARRLDVAICAIMHLNKKVDNSAADRILGSVAFKNVSRVALSVVRDPDDPDNRRYCIVTKSNLGAQNVGLSFRRVDHVDPLDAHGKIITVDIDNESHRGLDADALIRELAAVQRAQTERVGTLADTVMQVLNTATQPLTGAAVRELAAPVWRGANEGHELPTSWVQMVDNVLSRLCRAGRVHRLRHTRVHAGTRAFDPQLYAVLPAGLEDIL